MAKILRLTFLLYHLAQTCLCKLLNACRMLPTTVQPAGADFVLHGVLLPLTGKAARVAGPTRPLLPILCSHVTRFSRHSSSTVFSRILPGALQLKEIPTLLDSSNSCTPLVSEFSHPNYYFWTIFLQDSGQLERRGPKHSAFHVAVSINDNVDESIIDESFSLLMWGFPFFPLLLRISSTQLPTLLQ